MIILPRWRVESGTPLIITDAASPHIGSDLYSHNKNLILLTEIAMNELFSAQRAFPKKNLTFALDFDED